MTVCSGLMVSHVAHHAIKMLKFQTLLQSSLQTAESCCLQLQPPKFTAASVRIGTIKNFLETSTLKCGKEKIIILGVKMCGSFGTVEVTGPIGHSDTS